MDRAPILFSNFIATLVLKSLVRLKTTPNDPISMDHFLIVFTIETKVFILENTDRPSIFVATICTVTKINSSDSRKFPAVAQPIPDICPSISETINKVRSSPSSAFSATFSYLSSENGNFPNADLVWNSRRISLTAGLSARVPWRTRTLTLDFIVVCWD